MRMVDILQKKRHGAALTAEEIRFFVQGCTDGTLPDYQLSAMLMAICCCGMDAGETAVLTEAMAHSGDTVDLSRFGDRSVDKHSTGGVGDKTTLIVAPLVAALGGCVAKMSGRGLGHIGGTVDKLEAIPGYRTELPAEAFLQQVERVGVAVIGQSGDLTPADKKLYALRDVTATVDSIPLITSSIMSKKLAAGSHSIVLDVKVGSGAFMKTPEQARQLAEQMVCIGRRCGRRTAALLTNMDVPLGCAVGNALEVAEAVAVLRGESRGDLRRVCVALAALMTELTFGCSPQEAAHRAEEALDNGAAYRKMQEWIAAQGGDVRCILQPELLPQAACSRAVPAARSGYIAAMDAEQIGVASMLLGAGRAKKGDPIDPAAGICLHKKTGQPVEAGEPLCTLYTNRPETLEAAAAAYTAAITIGEQPPVEQPLIYDTVR